MNYKSRKTHLFQEQKSELKSPNKRIRFASVFMALVLMVSLFVIGGSFYNMHNTDASASAIGLQSHSSEHYDNLGEVHSKDFKTIKRHVRSKTLIDSVENQGYMDSSKGLVCNLPIKGNEKIVGSTKCQEVAASRGGNELAGQLYWAKNTGALVGFPGFFSMPTQLGRMFVRLIGGLILYIVVIFSNAADVIGMLVYSAIDTLNIFKYFKPSFGTYDTTLSYNPDGSVSQAQSTMDTGYRWVETDNPLLKPIAELISGFQPYMYLVLIFIIITSVLLIILALNKGGAAAQSKNALKRIGISFMTMFAVISLVASIISFAGKIGYRYSNESNSSRIVSGLLFSYIDFTTAPYSYNETDDEESTSAEAFYVMSPKNARTFTAMPTMADFESQGQQYLKTHVLSPDAIREINTMSGVTPNSTKDFSGSSKKAVLESLLSGPEFELINSWMTFQTSTTEDMDELYGKGSAPSQIYRFLPDGSNMLRQKLDPNFSAFLYRTYDTTLPGKSSAFAIYIKAVITIIAVTVFSFGMYIFVFTSIFKMWGQVLPGIIKGGMGNLQGAISAVLGAFTTLIVVVVSLISIDMFRLFISAPELLFTGFNDLKAGSSSLLVSAAPRSTAFSNGAYESVGAVWFTLVIECVLIYIVGRGFFKFNTALASGLGESLGGLVKQLQNVVSGSSKTTSKIAKTATMGAKGVAAGGAAIGRSAFGAAKGMKPVLDSAGNVMSGGALAGPGDMSGGIKRSFADNNGGKDSDDSKNAQNNEDSKKSDNKQPDKSNEASNSQKSMAAATDSNAESSKSSPATTADAVAQDKDGASKNPADENLKKKRSIATNTIESDSGSESTPASIASASDSQMDEPGSQLSTDSATSPRNLDELQSDNQGQTDTKQAVTPQDVAAITAAGVGAAELSEQSQGIDTKQGSKIGQDQQSNQSFAQPQAGDESAESTEQSKSPKTREQSVNNESKLDQTAPSNEREALASQSKQPSVQSSESKMSEPKSQVSDKDLAQSQMKPSSHMQQEPSSQASNQSSNQVGSRLSREQIAENMKADNAQGVPNAVAMNELSKAQKAAQSHQQAIASKQNAEQALNNHLAQNGGQQDEKAQALQNRVQAANQQVAKTGSEVKNAAANVESATGISAKSLVGGSASEAANNISQVAGIARQTALNGGSIDSTMLSSAATSTQSTVEATSQGVQGVTSVSNQGSTVNNSQNVQSTVSSSNNVSAGTVTGTTQTVTPSANVSAGTVTSTSTSNPNVVTNSQHNVSNSSNVNNSVNHNSSSNINNQSSSSSHSNSTQHTTNASNHITQPLSGTTSSSQIVTDTIKSSNNQTTPLKSSSSNEDFLDKVVRTLDR